MQKRRGKRGFINFSWNCIKKEQPELNEVTQELVYSSEKIQEHMTSLFVTKTAVWLALVGG